MNLTSPRQERDERLHSSQNNCDGYSQSTFDEMIKMAANTELNKDAHTLDDADAANLSPARRPHFVGFWTEQEAKQKAPS
jgi:hypothetical protein